MSSYRQFNEGISRLDGDDISKGALWERMTNNLTKEDVKRITKSKEVVVKEEPKIDPYSDEEMRQYMINKANEEIDAVVGKVLKREEKVEGYQIDREVLMLLVWESGNHIKRSDAVEYIKAKYNDDENALLKQLEDVRQRKAKVAEFEKSYKRDLNGA